MRVRLSASRSAAGAAPNSIFQGVKDAFPIVCGYFPLAFAYGVLAVQAGLGLGAAIAMSVFVYAGAAQYIAVSMLAVGTDPAALTLTTLVVNLRHLLMSAAIGPRLTRSSRLTVAAIAFHLTDETFAVMSTRQPGATLSPRWIAGLQWSSYLSWVSGSALGAVAGGIVTDPARWGLDYALAAMFIALLMMQLKQRATLIVVVISALFYQLACLAMSRHWAVIVAAIMGATVGLLLSGRGAAEREETNTVSREVV